MKIMEQKNEKISSLPFGYSIQKKKNPLEK